MWAVDLKHIPINNKWPRVKIGNLKKKNKDHKKALKQDEDAGSLQILLHLRSLYFECMA